jgi:hypothetical protein
MLIEFQQVPTFTEGQLLSANDLNTFNQNNTMIKKLFAAPQPLFMDSHAYAPKVLPLYWRSPEFVIWEGSFLYREGMRKAYLGFHIKLDGLLTNNDKEYSMSSFGDETDSVNIGVILKHTPFSYKNIYTASGQYMNYYASAPLNEAGEYQRKSNIYTFTIKNGQSTNVATTAADSGTTYLQKNARVSELVINLDSFTFSDGEIVPIKLLLLVNENPLKGVRGNALFKTKYENFNNYFVLKPAPAGMAKKELDENSIPTEGVFYSHLYAYTDGDLSYTDNWASVSGVVTEGNNVLSTSNMRKLSGKQRYITDRLKNRPMPLTGAILYLSALGGSSTAIYPAEDNIPGEWEYSKEEYAHAISNDVDEYAVGSDNLYRTVMAAGRINPHSNLATFAWNPVFNLYNQPTLSFKFFGNTDARQVLIVDFTEAPVSQTSTRNNYIYAGTRLARSGHIFGYMTGSGLAPTYHTGYYGSVYNAHDMTQFVTKPGSDKAYKNHFFQVRIPSPNVRIYSPEFGRYSTETDWFLKKGFWEDQVQITFTKKSAYPEWGLEKNNDRTLQFGFIGDYPVAELKSLFTPKTYSGEFDRQYLFNKISEANPATAYNNSNWNWYMDDGSRGYSQIYVNLYDHSGPFYRLKANYISYCFIVGFDDFKLSDGLIVTPTKYQSNSSLAYSDVVSAIETIDSSLTSSYSKLFVDNPHFKNYNMFWGAPKSTLNMRHIYKAYSDKFFFFSKQRTGNILIVRGKNVTMYYGEIKKLKRDGNPFGSLHKIDDVDVEFEYSETIISGENEETKIFYLGSVENLPYNQRYYLQGDSIVYAAEFFEEPS